VLKFVNLVTYSQTGKGLNHEGAKDAKNLFFVEFKIDPSERRASSDFTGQAIQQKPPTG
jgi:hypothetical protein